LFAAGGDGGEAVFVAPEAVFLDLERINPGNRRMQHMAIVADRLTGVGRVFPGNISVRHDVTIHARFRIIVQVRRRQPGPAKAPAPQTPQATTSPEPATRAAKIRVLGNRSKGGTVYTAWFSGKMAIICNESLFYLILKNQPTCRLRGEAEPKAGKIPEI